MAGTSNFYLLFKLRVVIVSVSVVGSFLSDGPCIKSNSFLVAPGSFIST